MKLSMLSAVMLAGSSIFCNFTLAQDTSGAVPYYLEKYQEAYQESPRKAALQWFEQARLGMFIHWGVWGKLHAEWAMYNRQIPLDAYQQMAREVNASGFNADEIVRLAAEAGMNYITFVARHHDGFSLWRSGATDWDSVDYPMKRDFVAELAAACRKRGIPLVIYYSLGIDWSHPYALPRSLYPQSRPNYRETPDYYKFRHPVDFEKYRDFCKQQLTELCTRYGPIAGFWFDPLGGVLGNRELFNVQEFYDLIHQYQPQALIFFKTGATGTEDILVGERELRSISGFYRKNPEIARLADEAWNRNFDKKAEIAVCSQRGWAWSPKHQCLPAARLYRMLADAAGNNANLLLNFGPMPDGSIPEDVAENFRELGRMIREEDYPPLNQTTYLEKRKRGVSVDNTEINKTAR